MATGEKIRATGDSVVLNPDSFIEGSAGLRRTATDLIDGVGLFGSTHGQATWRAEVIQELQSDNTQIFNPQLPPDIEWNEKHAPPEAEALTSFSVIVFRLENKHLSDGSLGSIGEIGMAMTSALLRGQKIIISKEKDFGKSLTLPEAVNQYAALENWITRLSAQYIDNLQEHTGDDLKELSTILRKAMKNQRENPIKPCQKVEPANHVIDSIVVGGSAGGATVQGKLRVSAFRDKMMELVRKSDVSEDKIVNLSAEKFGNSYRAIFSKKDIVVNNKFREAVFGLQSAEINEKQNADLVAWPILKDGVSMASVAETGMLMFQHLADGKHMILLMEKFDQMAYLHEKFIDQQVALRKLISENHTELLGEFESIVAGQSSLTFKELRSAFGNIDELKNEFMVADSANRVRNLARAHLERLVNFQNQAVASGKIDAPSFLVAQDREEFMYMLSEALKKK